MILIFLAWACAFAQGWLAANLTRSGSWFGALVCGVSCVLLALCGALLMPAGLPVFAP